jgi:cellulose synthase/poly-beta-1,6-N-acetylglucosamine synthase-like glycosyltransferase/peptidoglycan/xylan/chitin deacetylase (PgdA/CDA1 family)
MTPRPRRRRPSPAAAIGLRHRLRSPPAHWRLLAFCLLVLLVLMGFEGFATHTIGASTESASAGTGAPLAHSRPILVARGDRLVSSQAAPGRRVALTFDDGPDPTWTPRVADVLRRRHVRGTFFVVGSEAARHPGIVRRLEADGNEIGNHTFTHAALTAGPEWRARLQLDLTEATLVGITGHYSRFMRPPYSATPGAVSSQQEHRLARLAGRRYYVALADFDGRDWERPGVASIVRHASPPGATGGIVLLHDGGGNRAQTVAAVDRLITVLRARGFRFVTLSELSGLSRGFVQPRAAAGEHRRGAVFTGAVLLAFTMTQVLTLLLLVIGTLVTARVVLLLGFAQHHRRAGRRRADDPSWAPSVAVIVPAYNEAVGIARAVHSLAESDYPDLDIVVVDDGSADDTARIVEDLGLDRVRLVRQDNQGKAAALNTGVTMSVAEVLVMVDGDTVFERDTVSRLVAALADPRVGAVSGNTKVGNRTGLLGRWQHIEYVTGFNLDRRMYEVLQCTPTVPGAIGAFRREALEEVGGVPGTTLAEDTDLTLAIGRTGRRVVYAEDARAWTEAPSTLGGLWRQRYRWSFGTMQAVWKHRGAVLTRDPRERRIGRLALPYIFFFQIFVPVAAPLIDLFALYGLVFADPLPVILSWLAFNALQIAVALYAFHLDRERPTVLWALPLQQFVYRQLMYLVIIESTISALVGVRASWRTIPRTGDVTVGP